MGASAVSCEQAGPEFSRLAGYRERIEHDRQGGISGSSAVPESLRFEMGAVPRQGAWYLTILTAISRPAHSLCPGQFGVG